MCEGVGVRVAHNDQMVHNLTIINYCKAYCCNDKNIVLPLQKEGCQVGTRPLYASNIQMHGNNTENSCWGWFWVWD